MAAGDRGRASLHEADRSQPARRLRQLAAVDLARDGDALHRPAGIAGPADAGEAAPPRRLPAGRAPRVPAATQDGVWNSLLAIDAERRGRRRPTTRSISCRSANTSRFTRSGRRSPGFIGRGSFEEGEVVHYLVAAGLAAASRRSSATRRFFPAQSPVPGERPRWLLNVTNDAWFGTSSGPYQHLVSARLRTIEEGLPMIRAANTGVSAVIDAYGRVLASLDMEREGVIDHALPPARRGTPYTQVARLDVAACLLAILVLVVCLRAGRARHKGSDVTTMRNQRPRFACILWGACHMQLLTLDMQFMHRAIGTISDVICARVLALQRSVHQCETTKRIQDYGKITPGGRPCRRADAPAAHTSRDEPGEARHRRRADVPADPKIRARLQPHRLEPAVRVRQGARRAGVVLLRRDAVQCARRPADVGPWPQGRLRRGRVRRSSRKRIR